MASDSVSDHHANDNNLRVTVDSVRVALEALKETKGSSLSTLKKYFSSTLPDHIPSREISLQLKKAIALGIRDGKISKQGKSRFLLGQDDDDGTRKRRRRRVDDEERPHRRRRSRRRRRRRRSRRRRRRSGRRRRRRSGRRRRRRSRRGRRRRRRRSRRRR